MGGKTILSQISEKAGGCLSPGKKKNKGIQHVPYPLSQAVGLERFKEKKGLVRSVDLRTEPEKRSS